LVAVGLIAAYSLAFPPGRPGADDVPEALAHREVAATPAEPAPAHSERSGIATAAVGDVQRIETEASSIAQASGHRTAVAQEGPHRKSRDFSGRQEREAAEGRFTARGVDDLEDARLPPAGPLGLLFGFR
jgi:hypothetical protein